jgi:hypothetical protein
MRNRRLIYYSLIGLLLTAFASCSQEDWEQEALGARAESSNSTRTEYIAYTIHVETAGTLSSLIKAGNYSDAQKLTITGNISYKDVNYVSTNMKTVEVLDLSGSKYDLYYINGKFLSSSTKIKEISLPNNIKEIRNGDGVYSGYSFGAFSECSSLTNITLPEGLIILEEYAFDNCSDCA